MVRIQTVSSVSAGEASVSWRRLVPLSIICLSLLLPVAGQSAQVEGLYQASAPVADDATAARNQAIREAFRRVVVKVTGQRQGAATAGLKPVIAAAPQFVQEYRYMVPASDASEVAVPPTGPEAGPAGGQQLLVSFDPRAVNRALREQGLPIWGATRPALLLWLGLEAGGSRRFLAPETDRSVIAAATGIARERGVPLLFPLLDLEDRSALQVSDVWGGFESDVREASRRYAPDMILTGRLVRQGARAWRARWSLYRKERLADWETRASSLTRLLRQGLEEAFDRVAARYAPAAVQQDGAGLLIRVDGIADLAGYARVSAYLRGLDPVQHLALVAVEPASNLYRVRARGGGEALQRGIALGSVLAVERVSPESAAGATEAGVRPVADFTFRLLP